MKLNIPRICHVLCMASLTESVSIASTTNDLMVAPGGTNDIVVFHSYFLEAGPTTQKWSEVWQGQFERRNAIIMSDSFGWQSNLRWIGAENHEGYGLNADYINTGRDAMKRAGLDSIRESLVQLPGVFDSKNWIDNFIVGSLAHTTEQSVRPTGITPVASQMAWWDDMLSRNQVTYGSRFLSGNYFYLDSSIGHWGNDGGPIGTVLVRLNGDVFNLQTKLEEQITLFITPTFAIAFGNSYQITDIRNSVHPMDWSVTLSHQINEHWFDGIVYSGLSVNDNHEFLAQVGMSVHPLKW